MVIIFLILFSNNWGQNLWEQSIKMNYDDTSLRKILIDFTERTGISIIFNDDLAESKIVSMNTNSSADEAVKMILEKTELKIENYDKSTAVIYSPVNKASRAERKVKNTSVKYDMIFDNIDYIKPVLISKSELKYPQIAIDKNIEGNVLVKFLVTTKGNVENVSVEKSSGSKILDSATIHYVKRLKYLPAQVDGKLHRVWTTLLLKYNIDEIGE